MFDCVLPTRSGRTGLAYTWEGKINLRNSEFKNDKSQSVEKVSQDVLKLIEDQNLSETEKGEVVLKVLRKIMKFSNSKDEKLA